MAKRKRKFNARKVEVEGIVFDSRLEAECYLHFRAACQLGTRFKLELQPVFELIPTQRPHAGKTLKKHTYTADFRITGPDTDIVIDVKSPATAEKRDFVINEKLMLHTQGILIVRVTSPNEAAQLMEGLKYA